MASSLLTLNQKEEDHGFPGQGPLSFVLYDAWGPRYHRSANRLFLWTSPLPPQWKLPGVLGLSACGLLSKVLSSAYGIRQGL